MATRNRESGVATVVAGAWLLISPWLLGFATAGVAAWTAWGVGPVIAGVGVIALARPPLRANEIVGVLSGSGLFLAPWFLGYAHVLDATINSWIIGLVASGLSAWELTREDDAAHTGG